jgi:hypothetical protein
VQSAARGAGLEAQCCNPFKSLTVRTVELLYACDEALRLIRRYVPPEPAAASMVPRAATGHGCSEAPRGILYHRYRLDDLGVIQDARIVPPTSQNLKRIEEDLAAFVPPRLDLPSETLKWCEQAVRNTTQHLVRDAFPARGDRQVLGTTLGSPLSRQFVPMATPPVLIVGIGNEWRGDDGAGIAAARALGAEAPPHARIELCDGEGTRLVSLWDGADRAIVIDAVRSGRPPGEVLRFDLRGDEPEGAGVSGDHRLLHAFGLASAPRARPGAACPARSPSTASRARR